MNQFHATVGEISYRIESVRASKINIIDSIHKFAEFSLFRSDEIEYIGLFRFYPSDNLLTGNYKREFLIKSETDIDYLPFVQNFSHLYYKQKVEDSVYYVFQTLEAANVFYEEFIKKEKEKTEIYFNLFGKSEIAKFQDLPESTKNEKNRLLNEHENVHIRNVHLRIAEVLVKLKNEFSEEKVLVFAVDIWMARSIDVYELNKILNKNKMKIQTYCNK